MAGRLTAGLLHHRGNQGTKGKLLAKSLEAYVLGLETINRLTITYRIETFCTLVCNAWELLLKAKLLDDTVGTRAIYYKTKPGERPRTISLRDCLSRVFADENNRTRRNVERVDDLRDASIHLFIGEVPKDVLGLLQACVLNYHRCLNDWFGVVLSDRVPVGLMTIVFDVSPEQLDLTNPLMRRRLGKEAADYLTTLTEEIRIEHSVHGLSSEFSVLIRYDLAIQKRPEEAAVLAVTGEAGTLVRKVLVARDPAQEWPWRQTELIDELNERLSPAKIGPYDVQAVVFANEVKKNKEWYFKSSLPNSQGSYSRRFADWFVTRYRQESAFLTSCRSRYRISQAKPKQPGSPTLGLTFEDDGPVAKSFASPGTKSPEGDSEASGVGPTHGRDWPKLSRSVGDEGNDRPDVAGFNAGASDAHDTRP